MDQYISKSAVKAEIECIKHNLLDNIICERDKEWAARTAHQLNRIILFLDTIEVKEVNLKKESELIADDIMINVQANKYHTHVYNTTRCDFNHSHLMLAARKGIELGIKAAHEEEKV